MKVQEYLDTINGITLTAQAEIRAIASNALDSEETQLESLYAEIKLYYGQNRDELEEQRSRGVVSDTWSQFRAPRIIKIEDGMISAMERIRDIATVAMTAIEELKWYDITIEDADPKRVEYVRKGTRHLIETLIRLKEVKLVNRGKDDVGMYVLGQPINLKLPDDLADDMRTVEVLELFLEHANTVDLNINDAISKVESEYIPLSAEEVRKAYGAVDVADVAYASDVRAIAGATNARTYKADINRITGPAKDEINRLVSWAFETREIHRMIKAINDIIKIIRKTLTAIKKIKSTYGQLDFIGTGIDRAALRQRDQSLLKVLQSIESIKLEYGKEVYLPGHLQLNEDDVTGTWISEVRFEIMGDNAKDYENMLNYFRTMSLTLTAMKSGRQVLNEAAREILKRRRKQAQKRKDREANQSNQPPSKKRKAQLHLKF